MTVTFSYNQVPLPHMKEYDKLLETKEGAEKFRAILDSKQPKIQKMPKSFWKENYIKKTIDWKAMFRMVTSDYRCYSAGVFRGGVSSNDNWTAQPSLLILDVDDGLTLDEAKSFFSGSQALISTTRNHMKLKNDVMCDRYRVILPLKDPITCTPSEYSKAMALIYEEKFSFVDESCKDASRIYFGYAEAENYYLEGLPFDFNRYLKIVKKIDAIEAKKKSSKPIPRQPYRNTEESTHKGFYERTWCTPEMLDALRTDEKMAQGGRNTTLFSYAKFLQGLGFAGNEVKEAILWINSQVNGLDEKEIVSTIFKSLRLN